MLLLVLMELVVGLFILYLGVTQMVLPLWRDMPLFPMFRGERRLRRKLAEATEKVAEVELQKEIDEKTQKADWLRTFTRPGTISRPARHGSGRTLTANRKGEKENGS
ncbi:MAG: hypothetical protein AAB461_01740 [Patescibacteria group bacterium]